MAIDVRNEGVGHVGAVDDAAVPNDRSVVEAEGPNTRENEHLPNLREIPYLDLVRLG